MDWQDELKILSTSVGGSKKNSSLKKKLSIVKRLRSIGPEEVGPIREDLMSEDMSRFASEMVSSLLLSRAESGADIKNIVRVTSELMPYKEFVRELMRELRKSIQHGIQGIERYWLAAYFFDMQILLQEAMGGVTRKEGLVGELCGRMADKPRMLFLAYLAGSYRDAAVMAEIGAQAKLLGPLSNEEDDCRLTSAAHLLGIEVCGRDVHDGAKGAAEMGSKEFCYYTGRSTSAERYEGSMDTREIREYMIKHAGDTEKLDALSRSIKGVSSQKEVVSVLMQLKLNPNCIAAIARVLKSMGPATRKVIAALFKEIYQAKDPGHSDVVANSLLISEMCKFREVTPDEMFGLLDHLFKARCIEACCACLDGMGRYFLLNETTSPRIREFIERIRNYKPSRMEAVHIGNCLARLLSPSPPVLRTDYRGFFRHFFSSEGFDGSTALWGMLTRNRAAFVSILLHPWDFEDIDFLALLAHKAGVSEQVVEMMVPAIRIMHKYSRHRCIALVKLYSSLVLLEKRDLWDQLIHRIFGLETDNTFKCKAAMMLLQKMPVDVRRQYLPVLKAHVGREASLDLSILFSNFCEGAGMEAPDVAYDDSFDEELGFIRTYG